MTENELYRLTTPYACGGIVVATDGKGCKYIADCAPIFKHWMGEALGWLKDYAESSGWTLEKVAGDFR